MKLNLPFWLGGNTLTKLKITSEIHWGNILYYLSLCALNNDPETCSENILDLLAWERSVKRIDGEPLSLFRKRVKFSLQNAQDAGSIAGFNAIFLRLGMTTIEQKERLPNEPFDTIFIEVQSLENQALLEAITRQYGRTCRKYIITKNEGTPFGIRSILTEVDKQTMRISA